MLKDIDAVIFDLDGTLVDSMWMWESIDIEYLNRYGIELPKDLQKSIEGMSFSETAVYFKNRFQLLDSLDQIKSDWNKMAWYKYENEVPIKEGVKEFLEYLKEEGIPAGIATSNSRELVDLIIEKHGLKEYFKSIRTSCEVDKGKPSPDIYLLVAKDLEVKPERCLVFEDVLQGVMAGKNANMKVCAVYDKYSDKDQEQKKRLADYYVHSMKEIVL
ncbi:HAD family phosphatase [Mobilitalea sibirica]|uniref:HAD family phosphatase n=2 Tax=Mobilitalea sibirica TaxID=1462919 RepID=A0A8J7HBT0_9FIRM|nr:HAD family phosphatase [Mobilitalea sibirica]MBH1941441.1 HAD family phosphatase [Mobilitalea sibirica]